MCKCDTMAHVHVIMDNTGPHPFVFTGVHDNGSSAGVMLHTKLIL